jgi:diguanylate cyclase (GGDEF)-like protein
MGRPMSIEAMTAAARKICALIWSPRNDLVSELKGSLSAVGLRGVRVGASLSEAIEGARPSVIIVDGTVSASKALAVCASAEDAQVPALLILAQGDVETLEAAANLGVSDFAEEPCSPEIIAAVVGALMTAAKESARVQEEANRARSHADRDELTGLRNRRSFTQTVNQVLDRARRDGHQAALLYLDLDRFKAVNDALGHSVGDVLLQRVAQVLENQVRPSDVVAAHALRVEGDVSRLGGDEFTILLSKVARAEDAGDVAQRILDALANPISAMGYSLSSTASIGISVFPDDGEDGEALLKCADMGMYAAKALGRGRYSFYRSAMGQAHHRRLEIEQNLRLAIERGELHVAYQPRIDLRNDGVCGMEALARWNSPTLGAVHPGEFIPVAEESGLIIAIGSWVLGAACEQLARWQEDGMGALRLSVNVSSQQFTSDDLVRTVTDILRDTGVDPRSLELEVTERLMLGMDENTALALRDLRAIGVTIALDDFGTGYSSLSCITRYPLDMLKIDRSIAAEVEVDPAAASIVSAVVTLGRALKLGVVAEGVDSLGQARIAADLGCDELQGFLASPPLSATEFVEFCRDWQGIESCVEQTDLAGEGFAHQATESLPPDSDDQ